MLIGTTTTVEPSRVTPPEAVVYLAELDGSKSNLECLGGFRPWTLLALSASEAGAVFGNLTRMNDGLGHRRLRQPIDELMATSFEAGALDGLVESELDRLAARCRVDAAGGLMRLAYRLPVLVVCRSPGG